MSEIDHYLIITRSELAHKIFLDFLMGTVGFYPETFRYDTIRRTMTTLPIRLYPDPVLKETAEKITIFDESLQQLARDMLETMHKARGIGLAANQVGILKRIIVMDISEEGDQPLVLINPEITEKSGKTASEEGCLSIPEYRETIKRAKEITVRANTLTGEEVELKADGLLGICLQHEIDHINGVLFVDHLSRLKREFFKRWLRKNADLEAD